MLTETLNEWQDAIVAINKQKNDSIDAEVLQAQEQFGEVNEAGVVCWFGKNPHSFPPGTKFHIAPQPPAPCQNCLGQEPDDLRIRDEYTKAEREIDRLQAKVNELEKDQSQHCPDCAARANGHSVLIPSAELKKLQTKVAELETRQTARYLNTNAHLESVVAGQSALIDRCRDALSMPCDRWNKRQSLIVTGILEAIATHRGQS